MIDLGKWLLENGARVRQACEWDCCTFPAAWAIDNGLPDPMEQWRGSYASDDEAMLLIEREGGLCALFGKALDGIGADRNNGAPKAGDIGVISFHGLEAGAIFTGQRWAFVTDRGLAFATLGQDHIAAAWSLPNG